MKNGNQVDEIVELLRVSLKKYIASGQLTIEDNALSLIASDRLKIKKLILDDGYEDPLEIDFSPLAPTLQLSLDTLGIGNIKVDSAKVAERLSLLIKSLLDDAYSIEKISLFNATIYQIKTESKSYKATAKKAPLMPAFAIEAFGKRTVIK